MNGQPNTRLRPTGHSLMQSGIWFPCKGLVPHKHLLQKENPANAMHILCKKGIPGSEQSATTNSLGEKGAEQQAGGL